jgi:GNAT superfamily N-acetyltransferase
LESSLLTLFDDYEIGLARTADLFHLPAIEVEAASIFPVEDIGPELRTDAHDVAFFEEVARASRLWVARSRNSQEPIGFAAATLVDGSAHLSEMDVLPSCGGRGVGTALVDEVVRWARNSGYESLTLTTFSHLAWNAPFYARLGFRVIEEDEQGLQLREILRDEAKEGLDPARRVAMSLDLTRSS